MILVYVVGKEGTMRDEWQQVWSSIVPETHVQNAYLTLCYGLSQIPRYHTVSDGILSGVIIMDDTSAAVALAVQLQRNSKLLLAIHVEGIHEHKITGRLSPAEKAMLSRYKQEGDPTFPAFYNVVCEFEYIIPLLVGINRLLPHQDRVYHLRNAERPMLFGRLPTDGMLWPYHIPTKVMSASEAYDVYQALCSFIGVHYVIAFIAAM